MARCCDVAAVQKNRPHRKKKAKLAAVKKFVPHRVKKPVIISISNVGSKFHRQNNASKKAYAPFWVCKTFMKDSASASCRKETKRNFTALMDQSRPDPD